MLAVLAHKTILVFVDIKTAPTNNMNIQLPNNDLINGKEITFVQMYDATDLTKSPTGSAIVSTLSGATLTVLNDSTKVEDNSPAVNFNQRLNSGIIRGIDTIKRFNMQSSFITILDSTLYSVGQTFAIEFNYMD
jgi:hypothetical protein